MLGFHISERSSKFTHRPFTFRESFVIAKADHIIHKFTLHSIICLFPQNIEKVYFPGIPKQKVPSFVFYEEISGEDR